MHPPRLLTTALSTALLALALTAPAPAQIAHRLPELDQVAPAAGAVAFQELWSTGQQAFFLARPQEGPVVPWVTDGTREGTWQLEGFCEPGVSCVEHVELGTAGGRLIVAQAEREDFFGFWSIFAVSQEPGEELVPLGQIQEEDSLRRLGSVADRVVFATGLSLWATGGEGPVVQLPVDGSGPAGAARLGGALYVLWGNTLYRTDGTAPGTTELRSLPELDFPTLIGAVGGALLIQEGLDEDVLLWIYRAADGHFQEAAPGATFRPYEGTPAVMSGEAFFVAETASRGEEVWSTDGTEAGSRRRSNLAADHPFSPNVGRQVAVVEGEAYVIASDGQAPALWFLGTSAGQTAKRQVCNEGGHCFPPTADGPLYSTPGSLFNHGPGLLLSAAVEGCPQQVVYTNGQPDDTFSLRFAMAPFCAEGFGSAIAKGDDLYFFGRRSDGLPRLFYVNGYLLRSYEMRGAAPGAPLPTGDWLRRMGEGFLFPFPDATGGLDPWHFAPGDEMALPLVDVEPQRQGVGLLELATAQATDRVVLWTESPGDGGPVYQLLGASATGAAYEDLVSDPGASGLEPDALSEALGKVFFKTRTGDGRELWSTDGTAAGTEIYAAVEGFGGVSRAVEWNGEAFVLVGGSAAGVDLWATDGTAGGTALVTNLPSPAGSNEGPAGLWSVPSGLYALTIRPQDSFSSAYRLWRSDGTEEGTELVQEWFGNLRFQGFVEVGGKALFLVHREDSVNGDPLVELWGTDGTAAGTARVVDDTFRGVEFSETNLVKLEDEALFFTGDVIATDGTAVGTRSISSNLPSRFFRSGCPSPMTVLDGAAYFAYDSVDFGCELAVSDGTAGGTRLLADLVEGGGSSAPTDLVAAGGRLFFTAATPGHGRELWVSDGTAEGTRLAHDLRPGAASSGPGFLAASSESLFLRADDGVAGGEIWALPLTGDSGCAVPGALCLQGDRFRVESRWLHPNGQLGAGVPVKLSSDTGTFWFFAEENVELMVKVLDGRTNNDHFWTFFGALSNVQYWVTVTDAATGLTRRYFNPARNFASVGDTRSFGPLGASLKASPDPLVLEAGVAATAERTASLQGASGSCTTTAERLCLNDDRFAVEVIWKDFRDRTGTGKSENLTDDTGTFWFFRQENRELVVKVLDGRANNGHFWVFYGSLTNVDFDLTVTDTQTGETRTYFNRGRRFASVGDTDAFPIP